MGEQQQRRVNNPLFSASVTGSTFEEYSQRAMLFPAQEVQPPPRVTPPLIATPALITPPPPPQQPVAAFSDYQNQPPQANLTSVFSSFSNVLSLNRSEEVQNLPPPPLVGIEDNFAQPNSNPPPIPLFNPSVPQQQLPPPQPSQGHSNTYRRIGNKRPQYAQPPGLVGGQQPSPAPPQPPPAITPTFPQNTPVETQSSVFLNPVTTIPQFTSWSSTNAIPTMAEVSVLSNPNAYSTTDGNVLQPPVVENTAGQTYRPVYHHWFYKQETGGKVLWTPFSMVDSLALEAAFTSTDLTPEKTVASDGGRYDVNILRRQRNPVYWEGKTTEVRRCSWFHKGSSDGRYTPYEENIATRLEEEFKIAFETNQWHRKVELENGENVVFHGPDVLVLFPQAPEADAWGNTPSQTRPRIVKRGMDEFDIDEGEPEKVDHLLFLVHGIGSVCDLRFRTVEEVVDDFRQISLQLIRSHYRSSCEQGVVNRLEVLPISWHNQLHSEATGIDEKLKSITLESIPRLRDFTNDTLLDILFYTSPCYCQTIINTVGSEINRVYELFKLRNPSFNGNISLGGHSLGSLILFDLLCHQQPEPQTPEEQNNKEADDEEDVVTPLKPPPLQRRMSRRISYMMTANGTGQPQLNYPNLTFHPKAFFALGSPVGMFVTIRGLDTLGEQFELPTCSAFFNIFHPYDPVAYRIESLINPQLSSLKPVLIPHHKGRKRMHLELKETVWRVGTDLKQRIKDSVKNTLNSFYQFTKLNQMSQQPSLEEEVDRALENEISRKTTDDFLEEIEQQQTDLSLGLLNKGRRIDYVLQEAPLEFINEYIFALKSHVCYWESEDTMLLILKEIYGSMGVESDSQIPQQTMTIERPPPSPKQSRAATERQQDTVGMDPTVPIAQSVNLGPPPMSGFVRKT